MHVVRRSQTVPPALERFRAKWPPVRVKKTRQNKRLEPRSDSIGTGKALVEFLDRQELEVTHDVTLQETLDADR